MSYSVNNNMSPFQIGSYDLNISTIHPKRSAQVELPTACGGAPPNPAGLCSQLDMTTSNTIAATQNWGNLSKNCEKDRLINRIALSALIVLGVLMLAGGIALCATGVGAAPGAVMCVIGATMALLCPMFLAMYNTQVIKYEDPKEAQQVVNMLETLQVDSTFVLMSPPVNGRHHCRRIDTSHLVKYGFIQEDHMKEIMRRQKEYFGNTNNYTFVKYRGYGGHCSPTEEGKRLQKEFQKYIKENVVPNLPDPYLVTE